jgi:hypothetical protein
MPSGRTQYYWHGEGTVPTGYRKGPLFDRLINHLKDSNVELSATAHIDIYNNNPWLWKINPDKFYPYFQSAYEKMGKSGKKHVGFDEDDASSNFGDDENGGDTVDSSIDGQPTHGQEKPMSIIKTNGRYADGNVDELNKSLGKMSLMHFQLQLNMTADEHKKVSGWTCWESDTGRMSDDDTKTLRELNMKKRIAHPQDFPSYKLHLVPTGSTGTGFKLEEECPAISEADDADKEELMESVQTWIETANKNNTLLTTKKLGANSIGRETGLTDMLEKEKIKPAKDSDEGTKIRKNKIQYELPYDPTTDMPMQASCNDWQGDTYAAPPSGDNRYRIKLTHKPILAYDKSHEGDVDGAGDQLYYETVRHYIFATIPVGVRTDTGNTPKKARPKEDQTTDIARQKAKIDALKAKIGK